MSHAARTYVAALWARREFAWYMAMGNLKSRNASTALGLFWWILNPILLGGVYFLVFGVIIGIGRDLAHLLSGMFVFYYTSTSVTGGANSIIANSKLLVNISFPRLIMPIVAVTEASVGFLASIPALYLIIIPTEGVWPGTKMLWLFPIIFVMHTVFNLGLATLTARIAVPFRDINNFIPYVLRVWLYLSPIIYPASQILDNLPAGWESIYNLNPMVPFLSVYRSALLGQQLDGGMLAISAIWAIIVAGFAILTFVKYEGRMARYL